MAGDQGDITIMLYFEDIPILEKQLTAIQCNRCKKVIYPDDIVEWQEFISLRITPGYGSVWGDGNIVRLDLCQQCAYDLFREYVQDEDIQE